MDINFIIQIIHTIFISCLIISPFINNCFYKLYSLVFIGFIFLHYITKYGKCGLINIERFFLQENFKDGIVYKLIKPIISYKNNIIYENGMDILFIYIIILCIQIYNQDCVKLLNYDKLKKLFSNIFTFNFNC